MYIYIKTPPEHVKYGLKALYNTINIMTKDFRD
jgi:hypothetical protein